MTLTDPDAPTHTVHSRYFTVIGATVTMTRHTPDRYTATCDGCHDTHPSTDPAVNTTSSTTAREHPTRDWAQNHAAACRALPQGSPA